MKKYFRFVAIATLVLAAGLITIQSCKKEQRTLSSTQTVQNLITHPENIEDMDAYLKGFGEKMLNSKDDAMLTIEEASWHLTAYQNFCFGDADKNRIGMVYEENEYIIPVSNGKVALADLGNLFNISKKDILAFYKSVNQNNKKIMYVLSEIAENGTTKIKTAVSYTEESKYYYFDFEDEWAYREFCDSVFPNPNGYTCKDEAPVVLKAKMYQFGPSPLCVPYNQRQYYTNIAQISPISGVFVPTRIFYCQTCTSNMTLDSDDMCFYLDSYLGLLVENTPNGKEPLDCDVVGFYGHPESPNMPKPIYHVLYFTYGTPTGTQLDPILN
ncbi:MAG: hypothetical protein II401_02615 [Bacteroidales bacterium]|nr:hypothetical protein [Bacteroidales bacterium]